ncbi:MAG: insulinase family protein [Acidobacteria bacterium]|nr:insulinase family protein [Acidobacteriota bacterium]
MNLRWLPLGLLCTVLSAPQGVAQRRPARQAVPRPAYMAQLASFDQSFPITRATLKDGTRVFVVESHTSPLASVSTVLAYGYADEAHGEEGAAQLLSRLVPTQSVTSGAADALDDIRALGGTWRTRVGGNRTTYETVVSAPQWKNALELHSKLLLRPSWPADRFTEEKQVLMAESARPVIAPDEGLLAKLFELAYPDSGLSRALPRPGAVNADLDPNRVLEFTRRLHGPPRTILVIAGDVITSDVLGEVVALYGRGPRETPVRRSAPAGGRDSGFRFHLSKADTALPLVWVGFRIPDASSPDSVALEALRAVLALGRTSVIPARLRDEQQTVLSATADLIQRAGLGMLVLRMAVSPENIDRCEIGAFTELEILKSRAPGKEELARALALLESEYWAARQTVGERAAALADWELRGDWRGDDAYLERLRKIRPDDVQRVARKYLSLDNAVLAEYLPAGAEERKVTQESASQLLRLLLKPSTEQEMAKRDKETQPAYRLPDPPKSFKASELIQPMRKASILRGPELYIREDRSQPMIYMGFFYAGGRMQEDESNAGITALMLHSLLEGSTETPASRLYRQIEIYGGTITPVLEQDYFGVRFSVLSAHVEPALDLLIEMFKSPRLDDEDILRRGTLQAALAMEQGRDAPASARRELLRALFIGHPYSLPFPGDATALRSLTPDAVRQWYDRTVRMFKPIVVIVGDTRGTSLAEYFVENFSGSRYRDSSLPESYAAPVEADATDIADWGLGQTMAASGFQTAPWGDEDSAAVEVLLHYAREEARRFFPAIEEGQPFALSVATESEAWARGGYATVTVLAAPGAADKALARMKSWVEELRDGRMSYRDFRSARNSAVMAFHIRRQSRVGQIRDLAQSILSGRGQEHLEDWATRIGEVTMEDLPEVARRFLAAGKTVYRVRRGAGGNPN